MAKKTPCPDLGTKSVGQYLHRYAEKQSIEAATGLLRSVSRHWHYGVLIPVCGEEPQTLQQVFSKFRLPPDALVVVCLNQPDSHEHNLTWQRMNRQWLQVLQNNAIRVHSLPGEAVFVESGNLPDALVLKRFEAENVTYGPLPRQQGVGLARKLAADALLLLSQNGAITSPWFYSIDADTVLPADYFECTRQLPDKAVALSLPFSHTDFTGQQAIRWQNAQKYYDLRLAHYRAGIALVNRQYAWVPLGSTLVVSGPAYARVRGFPRRAAGEDFYLLNKLAKLGQVMSSTVLAENKDGTTLPRIEVQSRASARVPFGTGPAVTAIDLMDNPAREYGYYHPELFGQLAQWRKAARNGLTQANSADCQECVAQTMTAAGKPAQHTDLLLRKALGLGKFMHQLFRQNTHVEQRFRQFDEWLDAFRLLKAVHALESIYPRQNLHELAANEFFHRHFLADAAVSDLFHDLWPIA